MIIASLFPATLALLSIDAAEGVAVETVNRTLVNNEIIEGWLQSPRAPFSRDTPVLSVAFDFEEHHPVALGGNQNTPILQRMRLNRPKQSAVRQVMLPEHFARSGIDAN